MDTRHIRLLKRTIFLLAAGAALSGCAVYAPPAYTYDAAPASTTYYYPYSTYDYYGYGYPSYYVWPPVSLNFGYYHSHRSGGYGWRDHGWRGSHGWSGSRGYGSFSGSRGGWRGRR